MAEAATATPAPPPKPDDTAASPVVSSALSRIGIGQDIQSALSSATGRSTDAANYAMDLIKKHQPQVESLNAQEFTHPPAPKLDEIPDAPSPVPDKPSTRVFAQFLPVLAMLGGTLVKHNVTATLKAGSAAMKAAKANDAEAFQKAHDQWTDKVSQLTKNNQTKLDQYQAILNDTKLSMAERDAKLSALAASEDNAMRLAQIANGQITELAKSVQMELNATKILSDEHYKSEALNEKVRHDQQIEKHMITPEQQFKNEQSLRNELAKSEIGKAHDTATEKLRNIETIMADPKTRDDPARQADIIDSYTQILNGGRAIRQFQVDVITHNSGLPDKTDVLLAQANKGKIISSRMLESMAKAATQISAVIDAEYKKREERNKEIAKSYGLNPEFAVTDGDTDGSDPAGGVYGDGDVPTIGSQEEYDSLPSGQHYVDSNGNPGTKP